MQLYYDGWEFDEHGEPLQAPPGREGIEEPVLPVQTLSEDEAVRLRAILALLALVDDGKPEASREPRERETQKDPSAWARDVPIEYRTRPMSIREAAVLIRYKPHKKKGKQQAKQPAENLSRHMKDGGINYIMINRQLYIFDRRCFPDESQGMIVPDPGKKTDPN
jgi:hypothetical protein